MKRTATMWILLAAGAVVLAGCQGTVTRQAQVRPPGATPQLASDYAQLTLPLPANPAYQPPISCDPRPAIDILVANVQASYDAGEKEMAAGNSDQAQADFDHAVKLILKGGFQVDFDPRLANLFDEIGEVASPGEVSAAIGAGNQSESPAPSEQAPIDEIANLTLSAGDPRLALKAEQELITVRHDLPLTVNASVLQYLSFFTTPRGRAIVERGLERGGRYEAMIRRVLKQEGVPQDLIYLAQAESAFQPDAVSRAGARGIWQFMPFRGEEYDLQRSALVDERSDPEKSTRAAAEHMRDLYSMFGDWYLVMAAYNAGPLTVEKAIERTGYADFWKLKEMHALPRQTENYVPIIIALALVAKDPGLYGIQVDPQKPEPMEAVKLDHPIALQLAAEASGTDLTELHMLNPELLRNLTPNVPGFALNLPADTVSTFEENVQQVPEDKWTSWRLHEATSGETLPEIARHYHVTLVALERANHLERNATVPAGYLLNVPTRPPPLVFHYRVRRGDTLSGIAERFHVTVRELKRWNHMSGSFLRTGHYLRIYRRPEMAEERYPRERSRARSEARQELAHRVRFGETLYSIARRYQTTVSALRESNPFLVGRELQAGDVLTIDR